MTEGQLSGHALSILTAWAGNRFAGGTSCERHGPLFSFSVLEAGTTFVHITISFSALPSSLVIAVRNVTSRRNLASLSTRSWEQKMWRMAPPQDSSLFAHHSTSKPQVVIVSEQGTLECLLIHLSPVPDSFYLMLILFVDHRPIGQFLDPRGPDTRRQSTPALWRLI